jgi:putative acetyltransferase
MPPDNLTIRPFTDDDTSAFINLRNQPIYRFYTLATPFESVQGWQPRLKANTPQTHINLVATIDGLMVGSAGLYRNKLGRREHAATIGIGLDDAFHNQGIGTALMAELINIADNWLNLRRLELTVFTDNSGAIHLYKKFGFVIEGTFAAATFRDGQFVDSHLMARVAPHLPKDDKPYPPPAPPAPPTPYTLRAAEPADRDGITDLMNQPLVRHGTLRHPHSLPAQNDLIASPPDGAHTILAVSPTNKILGAASLTTFRGRRAHAGDLSLLAIHDAHHRQGIGTALLRATLDLADNWLNLARTTLTVFADNHPARALYTAHGFRPEATRVADAFRLGGYVDGLSMARVRGVGSGSK